MPKQLKNTLLTSYASTRLTPNEKVQLVHIATQRGKKPGVILREAFRFYLTQSVLIPAPKKIDEDADALKSFQQKLASLPNKTRPQNI